MKLMDLFLYSSNIVVLMIIYVYEEALQGAPNGFISLYFIISLLLISLYYLETQRVLHVRSVMVASDSISKCSHSLYNSNLLSLFYLHFLFVYVYFTIKSFSVL